MQSSFGDGVNGKWRKEEERCSYNDLPAIGDGVAREKWRSWEQWCAVMCIIKHL